METFKNGENLTSSNDTNSPFQDRYMKYTDKSTQGNFDFSPNTDIREYNQDGPSKHACAVASMINQQELQFFEVLSSVVENEP